MRTELKMPPGHSAVATRHFSFPHELIDDPSLNASQKREILCEWASDACAVESFPALRWLPGTTFPVTFSAVMDALSQMDRRLQKTSKRQHVVRLADRMEETRNLFTGTGVKSRQAPSQL